MAYVQRRAEVAELALVVQAIEGLQFGQRKAVQADPVLDDDQAAAGADVPGRHQIDIEFFRIMIDLVQQPLVEVPFYR